MLTQAVSIGSSHLPPGTRVVGPLWHKLPGVCGSTPIVRQTAGATLPGWEGGWKEYGTYFRRPAELLKAHPDWPVTVFVQQPREGNAVRTLRDLKQLIEKRRGRELRLPGGPAAYAAAQDIISEVIDQWTAPAGECVREARGRVEEAVRSVVEKATRPYPALHEAVLSSLLRTLAAAEEECQKGVRKLLQQEQSQDLFTQNDNYLQDSFNKAKSMVRRLLGLAVAFDELAIEARVFLMSLLKGQ